MIKHYLPTPNNERRLNSGNLRRKRKEGRNLANCAGRVVSGHYVIGLKSETERVENKDTTWTARDCTSRRFVTGGCGFLFATLRKSEKYNNEEDV